MDWSSLVAIIYRLSYSADYYIMLSFLLTILYILCIFTFSLSLLSLDEELFIDYKELCGFYIDLPDIYVREPSRNKIF